MFGEVFKQIPWQFKIMWVLGAVAQGALVGFVLWAIYKLVTKFAS